MAQAFSNAQASIVDAMKMVEAKVMTLAPPPGGERGFAFVKSDARATSGADDMANGIIVDMALDVLTGGASSMATIGGMDASAVVDAADEYFVDRAQTKQQRSQAFSKAFGGAAISPEQQAFDSDVAMRTQLEMQYAKLSRALDMSLSPENELKLDYKKMLDRDYNLDHPSHMMAG